MAKQDLQLPSDISAWKAKAAGKKDGVVVTLPSGLSARVRLPGMEAFVTGGTIPNELIPIITKAMNGTEDVDETKMMQQIIEDPKMLEDMLAMLDNIAVMCFLEPAVNPTPSDDEERDEELLYADEVDMNDKMFVFQLGTGGTADLEKFRSESEERVEAAQRGAVVPRTSKPTDRPKKRKPASVRTR